MASETGTFAYSGNELELFAAAVHWKAYWSSQIEPYLGQQVLELGAGLGATARALNHRCYQRWVGLEPDDGMCAQLRKSMCEGGLPGCFELRHGTSRCLSSDERFDTILYIDVLEHIEQDRDELALVADHLTDGGHIVILAPAHNFLYSDFDNKVGHHRRYDKALLRAIVPHALRIKRMHYLDSVGMLASLANRWVLKAGTPTLAQVKLWDSGMVRASRWVDRLCGHRLGKSIVCILEKMSADERAWA